MSGTNIYELVTLAPTDKEHQDVSAEFQKTSPNSQIVKVYNSLSISSET